MKRIFLFLILFIALFAVSVQADKRTFIASLSGGEEVPPTNTNAAGEAIFKISKDSNSISFKLIVANIENVVAAHIHLAPAGSEGPVVVSLFGGVSPGGGLVNGVIAEGTISAADLVGPLEGQSLEDLIEEIQTGGAYVNVHTDDGVGEADTGPGDFASGEIRGQIR
jgi:hypothetical protein